MTRTKLLDNVSFFTIPDIAQKDIEINAEAVKELMGAYLIDQLKRIW